MKPMKGYQKTPTLDKLKYPLYASPKLDGIRALIKDGVALSNSLKPIPNLSVQAWAKRHAAKLEGLDGELMVHGDFNDVQSVIMSIHGSHQWTFNTFDLWNIPTIPFTERLKRLHVIVMNSKVEKLNLVAQLVLSNAEDLQNYWDWCVGCGYEGTMTRTPNSPYKYGRSTLNEGYMIKLKAWEDSEAEIIDFVEMMHNENEAFIGELGQTKRSKQQDGMRPAGVLGSFIVTWRGKTFNIGGGPGLTTAERVRLWNIRETLRNKALSFKFFGVSKDGIPRHPNYKGVRYDV